MPTDSSETRALTYTPTNGALDQINVRLLAELSAEPRLTMSELGRRVGMSAPAVTERVRRLEEAGVIQGYRLEINPAALGLPLAAYVRIRPDPGQLPRSSSPRRCRCARCHSPPYDAAAGAARRHDAERFIGLMLSNSISILLQRGLVTESQLNLDDFPLAPTLSWVQRPTTGISATACACASPSNSHSSLRERLIAIARALTRRPRCMHPQRPTWPAPQSA